MIRWLFFSCLCCLAIVQHATLLAVADLPAHTLWQFAADDHSQDLINYAVPVSGQAENDLESSASKSASGSWKKNLIHFSAIVRQSERLHFANFLQYENFAANLPVRLRKANLFFPYHYFW